MDFSPLDSKQLMTLAKTSTIIKKDLSNLWQLNNLEYENLVSSVIGFLTATNPMLLALGACYSKVIYNYNSKRFNDVIFILLNKKIFDINKYDDFYAIDIVLSFCESNIYSDFLKNALRSSDIDVKKEAMKETNENSSTMWFKYYKQLYLELTDCLKSG